MPDRSVGLVVTSPPYWHLKDYGVPGQIGYGQSLHEYLLDLARVWNECWRVLLPGRRLCINVGDQFARAAVYGRYKVIPIHAEIIGQCETIGFDYMGAIIWQKKTTMRPTGGAVVMGSFPFPPSGVVELDYEFVLVFRKPGVSPRSPARLKERARLTRDEWKEYFRGHWTFCGQRRGGHEAAFPPELPRRLVRMFSFPGEVVLDPFVGSGTTVAVALQLERRAIGYEIQPAFLADLARWDGHVVVVRRETPRPPVDPPPGYVPRVADVRPLRDPSGCGRYALSTSRVASVGDDLTLCTGDGLVVSLLGISIPPERRRAAKEYLARYVVGKRVSLRSDHPPAGAGRSLPVYLWLANGLFVNRKMIEMGLADADASVPHRFRERFLEAQRRRVLHGAVPPQG